MGYKFIIKLNHGLIAFDSVVNKDSYFLQLDYSTKVIQFQFDVSKNSLPDKLHTYPHHNKHLEGKEDHSCTFQSIYPLSFQN